jgi:hypothetical protein
LFPPSSTGDLNLAASNEESFSDYDNDEDGDLNTGGDVKRRGDLLEELTATIMKEARRMFLVVHSALDVNHLVSFKNS